MTAQEQMAAMRAAVQAELPALARELVTLSDQGFHEGGRFRELARALTALPDDQRLNIVIGEIKRVAVEVAASVPAGLTKESAAVVAMMRAVGYRETEGEDVAADAYGHACERMEAWQRKRAAQGKDVGTQRSLCDGMEWLYQRIEALEAQAEQVAEHKFSAERAAYLTSLCEIDHRPATQGVNGGRIWTATLRSGVGNFTTEGVTVLEAVLKAHGSKDSDLGLIFGDKTAANRSKE